MRCWPSTTTTDEAIERTVAEMLANVRTLGDAAVLDYTRRFDRLDAKTMAELELPLSELRDGAARTCRTTSARRSKQAAERVRSYHERQKLESWEYTEADGTRARPEGHAARSRRPLRARRQGGLSRVRC